MARPQITLKLATSLDGKIALSNEQSEWITGEAARKQGRHLRATHDAIAVGANTAVIDNPQLTTRLSGQPDPQRVVFDSQLRLSEQSNLVQTAGQTPTLIFYDEAIDAKASKLSNTDVRLLPILRTETGLELTQAFDVLKRLGINSLLVEGGGTLAASVIKLGFVDVIEWFRASIILGGDGRDCIGALGFDTMDMAIRYERVEISEIGDDIYERYQRLAT